MSEGWESRAEQWLAWARTPGFDAYWSYRDAFFDLVPPPSGRALEVGCGEGRVTRCPRAAAERDPDGEYVLGTAEALPFADGAFDLVVSYNALMDVADMPAAVAEMARVLARGGRLCACVTHPLSDAGAFATDEPHAPFVIDGPYLGARPFRATMQRGGLTMTFDGMIYPLEDYALALERAGLAIEALREPAPAPDAQERPEGSAWAQWRRVPLFLMFRAAEVPRR